VISRRPPSPLEPGRHRFAAGIGDGVLADRATWQIEPRENGYSVNAP